MPKVKGNSVIIDVDINLKLAEGIWLRPVVHVERIVTFISAKYLRTKAKEMSISVVRFLVGDGIRKKKK